MSGWLCGKRAGCEWALSRCEWWRKKKKANWNWHLIWQLGSVLTSRPQYECGKLSAALYGNKMRGLVYLFIYFFFWFVFFLPPFWLACRFVDVSRSSKILLPLDLERSIFWQLIGDRTFAPLHSFQKKLNCKYACADGCTSKNTHTHTHTHTHWTSSKPTWHKPFKCRSQNILLPHTRCILHTVQLCIIYTMDNTWHEYSWCEILQGAPTPPTLFIY